MMYYKPTAEFLVRLYTYRRFPCSPGALGKSLHGLLLRFHIDEFESVRGLERFDVVVDRRENVCLVPERKSRKWRSARIGAGLQSSDEGLSEDRERVEAERMGAR